MRPWECVNSFRDIIFLLSAPLSLWSERVELSGWGRACACACEDGET